MGGGARRLGEDHQPASEPRDPQVCPSGGSEGSRNTPGLGGGNLGLLLTSHASSPRGGLGGHLKVYSPTPDSGEEGGLPYSLPHSSHGLGVGRTRLLCVVVRLGLDFTSRASSVSSCVSKPAIALIPGCRRGCHLTYCRAPYEEPQEEFTSNSVSAICMKPEELVSFCITDTGCMCVSI